MHLRNKKIYGTENSIMTFLQALENKEGKMFIDLNLLYCTVLYCTVLYCTVILTFFEDCC